MKNFYHSVLRNNSGLIVDLANEIVYDEDIRANLFRGGIICETKKSSLESDLEEAIKYSNDINIKNEYNAPLLLSLHKQTKNLRKV